MLEDAYSIVFIDLTCVIFANNVSGSDYNPVLNLLAIENKHPSGASAKKLWEY